MLCCFVCKNKLPTLRPTNKQHQNSIQHLQINKKKCRKVNDNIKSLVLSASCQKTISNTSQFICERCRSSIKREKLVNMELLAQTPYNSRNYMRHVASKTLDTSIDCNICQQFVPKNTLENNQADFKQYKPIKKVEKDTVLDDGTKFVEGTVPVKRFRRPSSKKICYDKTNIPVSKFYGEPGRNCTKCNGAIKRGLKHNCTVKNRIQNTMSKLDEGDQERFANQVLAKKKANIGQKFRLKSGGRQRIVNFEPRPKILSKQDQLNLAVYEKSKLSSNNQFFNIHQKAKRSITGKNTIISNSAIKAHLQSLSGNWHTTTYSWLPVKIKANDKQNRRPERFTLKEDVCDVCSNKSEYKNLTHNDKSGNNCTRLLPDVSIRKSPDDQTLQKLYSVTHIKNENGEGLKEFLLHITEKRNWALSDCLVKMGFDSGGGSTKVMLQITSSDLVKAAIESKHPINTPSSVIIIGYSLADECPIGCIHGHRITRVHP